MKPMTAVMIAVAIAAGYATRAQADSAAFIKACQKDMITHCAEQMSRPDGLKACLVTKREKMSPECQKLIQSQG